MIAMSSNDVEDVKVGLVNYTKLIKVQTLGAPQNLEKVTCVLRFVFWIHGVFNPSTSVRLSVKYLSALRDGILPF